MEVPPLLLLFPVGRVDTMQVTPDAMEVSPWDAFKWAENGGRVGPGMFQMRARGDIWLFREYDRVVVCWLSVYRDLHEIDRVLSGETPDPESSLIRWFEGLRKTRGEADLTPDQIREEAQLYRAPAARVVEERVRAVHDYRDRMRERGLTPPPLPMGLRDDDFDETEIQS